MKIKKTALFLTSCMTAAIFTLSGCAVIPPDPGQPRLKATIPIEPVLSALKANNAWWQDLKSPALNQIIAFALKNNPSLAASAQRISQAQAGVLASHGSLQAGVGLGNSQANMRVNGAPSIPPLLPTIDSLSQTTNSVQAQAKYVLDWWGENKLKLQAAMGLEKASEFEQIQAQQILSTEIVLTYITLQELFEKEHLLSQMQQTQNTITSAIQEELNTGLASKIQLLEQQSTVESLTKKKLQLLSGIQNTKIALKDLLGIGFESSALIDDLTPTPVPSLFNKPPEVLNFQLLAHRADLQAMQWQIKSTLSQVDAAKAAFYPSINLTGTFANNLISMPNPFPASSPMGAVSNGINVDSNAFNFGLGLTLPIFAQKLLEAQITLQRSQRNTAIENYNTQVIKAANAVEKNSANLKSLYAQMDTQNQLIGLSSQQLKTIQQLAKAGMAGQVNVNQAKLVLEKTLLATVDLQKDYLFAQVKLIGNLGGFNFKANDKNRLTFWKSHVTN